MVKKNLLSIGLVLVLGCAPRVLPERAIIEPAAIKESIAIEKELDAKSETPPPAGVKWFEVLKGDVPIIVTAPHSTKPFREGQYRFSDGGGTAALAISINKLSGAWVIYTTYASPSDPNYYDDNEFKETLQKIITEQKPELLLDIHGSGAERPYEVDFGTMGGSSLLGNDRFVHDLIDILHDEGIDNLSYNRFGGSQNATITKFASSHGVPSIQLEISATRVTPGENSLSAHRYSQMLQGLVRFVNKEKEKICAVRQCPDTKMQ